MFSRVIHTNQSELVFADKEVVEAVSTSKALKLKSEPSISLANSYHPEELKW